MGGLPTKTRAATVALAAALTLAGCESPVPFYKPGQGDPDAPVVGLGGPSPYAKPRPDPRPLVRLAPTPDVYATGVGMLTPGARSLPPRVFVPNPGGGTVDVIDPRTLRLAGRVKVGRGTTRVVPSWDLRKLWVDARGTLVPLSPRSAKRGAPLKLGAPGPLYFPPDGRDALVLGPRRLDVRDPLTLVPRASLPLPCSASGHADFSADASALLATCTSSARLVRLSLSTRKVAATLRLPKGSAPSAVRLSPDGRTFYVADPAKGGLWLIDASRFRVTSFVPTSPGARGLVLSRDTQRLHVVGATTVATVSFTTRKVTSRWPLPRALTPAVPGGISADGTTLWLSAPKAGTVYALSAHTGRLQAKLKTGGTPQAPVPYPQPARYSLGGPALYR
ncbi:YncE family protein [Spirillospora sp. CA-294931]|uniref:YncE family protein n=1 Tax=Spirillospora sp. CA-294931 TaxID=3240042 RepID=UPI003D93B443